MFAIAVRDESQRLKKRLCAKLDRLKGPAREIFVKALRVAYPLVLVGISIFVATFGAYWSALLALAAATILITRGFTPCPRQKRRTEIAAACAFCLAVAFGLPAALYNFSTEPCLGVARSVGGDVRSLDDPRLDDGERYWVLRAAERLAPLWPKQGVPPLDEAALANIVVQAKGLIHEIAWRGNAPLTRLGLTEAKQAYAALHFDRREVCYLYGAGERAHGVYLTNGSLRTITTETDRALALILPALQATYSGPALPAVASVTHQGVKLASHEAVRFN
jgi:hypothetical protein